MGGSLWRRLEAAMQWDMELVRFIVRPAAWLVFICSPLYWLLWHFYFPQIADIPLLRVTSSVVCVPILLYPRWPVRLRRWFPHYWHLAVLYIAPFSFTFLLLENEFSSPWLISYLGILLLLMEVIPNVVLNAIITVVGSLLGLTVWYLLHGAPPWDALPLYYPPILGFALGFSMIALYATRQKLLTDAHQRSAALMVLSGTIAHEVRKPLSQAQQAFDLVRDTSTRLREQMTSADDESAVLLTRLDRIATTGLSAMARGDMLIGMILRNIREERIDPADFRPLSMAAVVTQAVGSYAFARGQRERVVLDLSVDFDVLGDEILLVYVVFNLLQNALIYDQVEPNLRVTLTLVPGPAGNALLVADNGPGISPERQRDLFPSEGACAGRPLRGFGLPFCRRTVAAMNGGIAMHSTPNTGTVFTLNFPPV